MLSFIEDRLDWDVVYWSLGARKELLIQKDTDWFSSNLPSFTSVWQEVIQYRTAGTLPPPLKTILDLDAM